VLVAVIIYCGLLRTERFFNFNNVGAALFSLLVIIYCIMAFRKLAKRAVPIFLEKTALFWVVSGFLLFFSGSFFVFVFWNYSAQSTLYPTLWMVVHDGFNILKCIFIAISFTRKIEQ
jgi:hypothetical protein